MDSHLYKTKKLSGEGNYSKQRNSLAYRQLRQIIYLLLTECEYGFHPNSAMSFHSAVPLYLFSDGGGALK